MNDWTRKVTTYDEEHSAETTVRLEDLAGNPVKGTWVIQSVKVEYNSFNHSRTVVCLEHLADRPGELTGDGDNV